PGRTLDVAQDYLRIGGFLASNHREREGAEFFRKALTLNGGSLRDPNNSADALYYLAIAQLRVGDQAGYRATCKALVEIPLSKLEGATKSRPVWTPCIGPDALEDPSVPVKLGEELVASKSLNEPRSGLYML